MIVLPGVCPGATITSRPGSSGPLPDQNAMRSVSGDSFLVAPASGPTKWLQSRFVAPVGGVGEHDLTLLRGPADVVEVQVREQHVGDVGGLHTVGGQAGEAARRPGTAAGPRGRTPQSTSTTRSPDAHEEAAEHQLEVLAVAVRNCRCGSHASARHREERVGDRDARHTVEDRQHLESRRLARPATLLLARPAPGGGRTAARRHRRQQVRASSSGSGRCAGRRLALDEDVVGAVVAVPRGRGRVERLRLGRPPRLVVAVVAGLGRRRRSRRRPSSVSKASSSLGLVLRGAKGRNSWHPGHQ